MSVYSKARELADEILASEESLRLSDVLIQAENGGVSDEEVYKAMSDYNALVEGTLDIVRMSAGVGGGCQSGCGVCGRG